MDCKDTPMLVHGYIDGELALTQSLEFEAHVKDCAACRGMLRELQELKAAIREHARYHAAPEGLEQRLRGAIGLSAVAPVTAPIPLAPRRAVRSERAAWQPLAMAAALVLAVLSSSGVTYYLSGRPAGTDLADQAVDDHLRSLLANHLTDVASSNQHTVKPWFAGKLDLSPPVKDLADEGYPLIGGRLDYLNNQPVAALVYRHGEHIINVFVGPATAAPEPGSATRRGYNLLRWTHDKMDYWAVSDADTSALQELHKLLETAPSGPEPAATQPAK